MNKFGLSSTSAIVGHSHSMKVVTKDWLIACIREGAKVKEDGFLPEVAVTNNLLRSEDINKHRKNAYNVKRGLFKNMTFAIKEDCYDSDQGVTIVTSFGEFESKEEIIEYMTRAIFENGGKVVPHSAHYIITEDGADA
jgi:hypothetical protein